MYYQARQIILEDQVVHQGYLEVVAGKVVAIHQDRPQFGTIDETYAEAIIAPGLVDTHIHGYGSYDVMDNSKEGLQVIAQGLLECGVTSWLPTTLTASIEELSAVVAGIADCYQDLSGARVQGIFLEGPYFTEKYKGAQNAKYMSDPSIDQLAQWIDLAQGLPLKIAIAPERRGVDAFTRYAVEQGVAVALAHSDATYDQAMAAVQAGASIFVHTYNGMSGLHHREPGMVGAALTANQVFAELICDGHHVHPAAAKIVTQCRGFDETVLITDCMRAGGIGEGPSKLGELEVMVHDGKATLVDGGNLAGSILTLIESVQNVVAWGLAPLEQALRMASWVPAQSVGIEDRCGCLAPGYPADFIVVDDQAHLLATYLAGEEVYSQL
ncbi:N-acetylglucosamine-6-phosphate deacetylase [Hutsoniella sourekii]|uniref:N-acetylglucosamine-6-phosphate deacetylase n=1 Tax=Hutsoniella sourekii TaxID=87650 RepID=UPI0004BA4ED5|nr:N-acetylglucosamine-6-phosphate deacetylase [Hutsoniella sourekii]